ncbi:uncharacterized protein PG986_001192 [Apiospora aurea]|uniref:BTB domain-containing protein n=1 Tax=Apiospora aurea TaxID=335848 RepID=A0ABR1QXV6_9PEZI
MGKKRLATEISGEGNHDHGTNGGVEVKCCEAPETMVLDPDGDVTIKINCPRCAEVRCFQASSHMLSLASTVFAKMLGPDFKEGHQLRKDGRVTVTLHDDDPDATERVLCALHYHPNATTAAVDVERLVPMALFCDKYDCCRALAPWVLHWCKVFTEISVAEAGYMLLAAYLFRASNFYDISSKIAGHLPPTFAALWKRLEKMSPLPQKLIGSNPFPYGSPLLTSDR